MLPTWLERTELLVGSDALERLQKAHVLVVGLGGVGSFAAEFLARSGVGHLTIVDGDVVDPTNRNRQLQALSSTHGQKKAWLMRDRILDINPECQVDAIDSFLDPEAMRQLLQTAEVDFALDCIDSVQPKLNFPFARHIRKRLGAEYRIRKGFHVVFSSETANPESVRLTDGSNFKKSFYGTSAWIPASFGIHAASFAVRKLMASN